jgi:hypothetical protein
MARARERLRVWLVAVAATALVAGAAGTTVAAFSNSTSNPASSFSAKRIFPGDRYISTWRLDDAADGSAATVTYAAAFADGVVDQTTNWTNAWSATRFMEWEYTGTRPPGLSTSGVSFVFTFRDQDANTGNQWCYYLEARKISDDSVIATYGSSGTPLACEAAGVMTTVTTPLPAITTTDQVNDLKIRVFGMHSGGGKPAIIDRAIVSATGYAGYTLFASHDLDSADGTPATAYWGPAKVNTQAYQTGNWATAYSGTRYLELKFTPEIPGSATLHSASFDLTYMSQTAGNNTCFYFEVYAGATLLATHGNSTGADVDCNATTTYERISTPLPSVDTVGEANSLVVKLFAKNSGGRPMLVDGAHLKLNYSLDAGTGCADAGTKTITSAADTYVRQDGASANSNFGTAATMMIQAEATKLRRVLVNFDLPRLGTGCSVTDAKLRLYVSATGGARTLDAYAIAAPWSETAATWNNQPGVSGSPSTTASTALSTWTEWDVDSIASAMYAGTAYGFMVRDANEGTGTTTQTWRTRENTNWPELVLTVG